MATKYSPYVEHTINWLIACKTLEEVNTHYAEQVSPAWLWDFIKTYEFHKEEKEKDGK